MLFLLSGEGPTDLGECSRVVPMCEAEEFLPGPIAMIVAAIVDRQLNYNPLELGHFCYVPRAELRRVANDLSPRKARGVSGVRKRLGTSYFSKSARAIAIIAQQLAIDRQDQVIAILFADADTTDRAEWQQIWQSMLDGFESEGFSTGVPLLPQPTSEGWLLCILKEPRYQQCEQFEDRSKSAKASLPLKQELADVLGGPCTRTSLCETLQSRGFEIERMTMPSFIASRERMETILDGLS